MICVLCGKREAVYRGMCSDCASENIKVEFPSKIEFKECPKCGAVKAGNKWEYRVQEESIVKNISAGIKLPDRTFSLASVSATPVNDQESLIKAEITSDEGFAFTRTSQIFVRRTQESCPACDRKSGSYYEAIIQIRFEVQGNTDFMPELIRQLEMLPDRNDPNQFISRYEQKREGLDIYLGSRKLGEKMIRYLSTAYPGTQKTSSKLAGRKEGKEVYRFTFLYRIFNPEPGTIIQFNNRILCVRKLDGDRIMFSSGLDTKAITHTFQELLHKGYKLLKTEPDAQKVMVISSREGSSIVMDLETFRTSTVKADLPLREVVFSRYDGKLYFVD